MAAPDEATGAQTKELVAALRRGAIEERCAAAEALGRTKDPEAIEPLLVLLAEQHPKLKAAAAHALGFLCHLRPQDKKSESMVAAATKAQQQLRAQGVVDVLVAVLHEAQPEVRLEAARALGRIGDLKAIYPLLTVDGDVDVLQAVEVALRKIRGVATSEVFKVLEQALTDERFTARLSAAAQLDALGWQPTDPQHHALQAIVRQDPDDIPRLDDEAFEILVGLLKQLPSDKRMEFAKATEKVALLS